MNTLAWCLEGPNGSKSIYALFGATVLWASDSPGGTTDKVFQFAPNGGQEEAISYLVASTSLLEKKDWRMVGEPVEFDLSDAAMASLVPNDYGDWIYAPRLREELLAAVLPSFRGMKIVSSGIVSHATWAPTKAYVEERWVESAFAGFNPWDVE